ncbi:MAG: hypothetical protein JXM69_00910 [Anaerolineae bacterium]|nr:hypothetical protein [Anaerolineae bacterium]
MRYEPFLVTAYQQLFRPYMPASKRLDPADDGAHQLPGDKFFEWWYFDARFDNGYQLVVAFHTALFNVVSRPAAIAVHLYAPDGSKEVEVAVFKSPDVRNTVERCDVQIGSSRAWDKGDRYIIALEQGPIRANLEYHKEVEGVQIGTGVLFEDSASGQSFHWVVPLPRASVSGWLGIGDERVAVSGIGYHDHNWGNLDLYQAFHHWIWGRVLADEYTMVFGGLFGRGGKNSNLALFALWQDEELLFSTGQVRIDSIEFQTEGRTDVCYPRHIELQVNDSPQLVQAALCAEHILDIIDFAQPRSQRKRVRQIAEAVYFLSGKVPLVGQWVKQRIRHGTYLRLQMSCELTVANQGQIDCRQGSALCEVMDFGGLSIYMKKVNEELTAAIQPLT